MNLYIWYVTPSISTEVEQPPLQAVDTQVGHLHDSFSIGQCKRSCARQRQAQGQPAGSLHPHSCPPAPGCPILLQHTSSLLTNHFTLSSSWNRWVIFFHIVYLNQITKGSKECQSLWKEENESRIFPFHQQQASRLCLNLTMQFTTG